MTRRPLLIVSLLVGVLIAPLGMAESGPVNSAGKRHVLCDDKPAPLDLKGWEAHSFPLGNGHFGVSFFGGVGEELWQFTEKSLFVTIRQKPKRPGTASGFPACANCGCCRTTILPRRPPTAASWIWTRRMGTVTYGIDGVNYMRETFTSYPDRCFAARITASKPGKVSFRLKALHPYLGEYRSGTATADGNTLDPPRRHPALSVEIRGPDRGADQGRQGFSPARTARKGKSPSKEPTKRWSM